MESSSYNIFDRRTEKVFLLLPFCLFVGFLCFNGFDLNTHNDTEKSYLRWIAQVIFIGSIHPLFTLKNIWLMPEYRSLLKSVGLSFWKLTGLFLLFSASWFFYANPNEMFGSWPKYYIFFSVVIAFVPTMHLQRQTMGVSLLYNRMLIKDAYKSKPEEVERLKEVETRSRSLEHLAVWVLILTLSSVMIRVHGVTHYHLYLRIAEYVGFAISLGLYARALLMIPERKFLIKKLIFLSRLIPFYLLSTTTFLIVFYQMSNHGIEYFFIDRHMNQKSTRNRDLVIVSLLLVAVFGLLKVSMEHRMAILGLPYAPHLTSSRLWIALALSVAGGVTFMHNYLDYVVFKMKRKENREIISPLLPSGETEGAIAIADADKSRVREPTGSLAA